MRVLGIGDCESLDAAIGKAACKSGVVTATAGTLRVSIEPGHRRHSGSTSPLRSVGVSPVETAQ